MGTWAVNDATIRLIDTTTGENDVSTHDSVEYQPVGQDYPTGAISATQMTCLYRYKPASVLDTTNAYDIYVDGDKKKRIYGSDMMMMVGV